VEDHPFASKSFDIVQSSFESGASTGNQSDMSAPLSEGAGGSAANAGARSGDHNDFRSTRELHGDPSRGDFYYFQLNANDRPIRKLNRARNGNRLARSRP
jgi:hypothetical protein